MNHSSANSKYSKMVKGQGTIIATTGIPRFTLLMWGHKNKTAEAKPRNSRLLSSTKGEENRIEL